MNKSITRAEISEAKRSGQRVICLHKEDNRAKRRENEREGKILNNRKRTAARVNGNVLLKMAYFSLSVQEKIRRSNQR